MAKKEEESNEKSTLFIEPVIYLSEKAPKKIEEFVSDLITMSGIIKLSIMTLKRKKLLYSYERWGKTEKTLTLDEIRSLIKSIKSKLAKIDKKEINHLIIRSGNASILIFAKEKYILFLQCDNKAKLPLVTIKAKRIISKITQIKNK